MANSFMKIFSDEGDDLKIDRGLLKRVERYIARFVNSTDDNLQFLGSPLTGVYPFRLTTAQQNEWWDEVLEMDDLSIQSKIKEYFQEETNDFDASWKISSNAMNVSLVWLAYKFLTSKLSKKDAERGATAALTMLQYKFVTSLDQHFFPYPADSNTAQAVYAGMNKKFLLKKHASWMAVIAARTEDLLSRDSIHNNALHKFTDDEKVVYLMNDTQGRYKRMYILVTGLFHDYREQEAKIHSVSASIELSGEITVRDKTNNYSEYRQFAHEIASNHDSFMRKKALDTISSIVYTAPSQQTELALEWLSSNYGAPRCKYIQRFVELVITHACEYVRKEEIPLSDLGEILLRLRGIYLAPRQPDETVLEIRELGTKITDEAVTSKNAAVHSSVRAAIILYLVLRVLAKDNL